MPLSSEDLFDQIGPFKKKWWGLGRKNQAVKKQFNKIFHEGDTDEPVRDSTEYGGLGVAPRKDENAPVYQDRIYQANRKRFVSYTQATSTQISYEAWRDSKYKDLKKCLMEAGASMEQTPEYLCGLFMDRAFNSSYPVTGDGLPLCSTAHVLPKGQTAANALSTPAPLGEAGIEQIMTNLRTMPKSDGMLKPLTAKSVVVPSALYITGTKLSITKKQVGSFNNTESVVYGMEVIPFDYLTSNTRWFVMTDMNDDENGLFFDYRERPVSLMVNKEELLSVLHISYFRAMVGAEQWRCIYGSQAS